MPLKDFITALVTWFNSKKIGFAVIGGFALQAYGYVRATRDIDFIVREKSQHLIVNYLEEIGFETVHISSGFSNHIHPVGNIRVDFVYVDDLTADKIFIECRSTILFEKTAVPVVSARHLVSLKLFAARNDPERKLRELADIKEIMKNGYLSNQELQEILKKYGFENWIEQMRDGK